MKNPWKTGLAALTVATAVAAGGFSIATAADSETDKPAGELPPCAVHLFDGKNYKDDNIIVTGPGEFSDLSKLPNSKKDWNDEADSFKAGANAVVTFYTKTNFEGESVTYEKGAQKPKIDEPSSMKITCK